MAAALVALSLSAITALAAPSASDPCAKIAGKQYVLPSDALACLKSFPYNETLKYNVLSVVSSATGLFNFEGEQIRSPPPFQESTVNLPKELARINRTRYSSDFAFNRDLYQVYNNLNDGHTRWLPVCHWRQFLNTLPAPLVSVQKGNDRSPNVYIADDTVDFISQYGSNFTSYYDSIGFNWKQYAGARVLTIEGRPAYDYVDHIASTVPGGYLDHGIRVNLVVSSYSFAGGNWVQSLGSFAGPQFPELTSVDVLLIKANSTRPVNVRFPYLSRYIGTGAFTDGPSYWANNCVAKSTTNGVDNSASGERRTDRPRPIGSLEPKIDRGVVPAIPLPAYLQPTATPLVSSDVVKAYILPNSTTAVLMVGSFSPADYEGFQVVITNALAAFKSAGATKLIVDVSNNGGGYVCLGYYLHQALVGRQAAPYGGFKTSLRVTPVSQKILNGYIARGLSAAYGFYPSDNYAFLNGTQQPPNYDYFTDPVKVTVNGFYEPHIRENLDICEPFSTPPPETAYFSTKNILVVSNGACGSTCSQFSTNLKERHNIRVLVFGGKPGAGIQYKGLAGNQVLDWPDLDGELKTSGFKPADPTSPPDLLVDGDIRINWRVAYSWIEPQKPIAFRDDQPTYHVPYTSDIVHSPQKLWQFVAAKYL